VATIRASSPPPWAGLSKAVGLAGRRASPVSGFSQNANHRLNFQGKSGSICNPWFFGDLLNHGVAIAANLAAKLIRASGGGVELQGSPMRR
jgi:hypothetical protein